MSEPKPIWNIGTTYSLPVESHEIEQQFGTIDHIHVKQQQPFYIVIAEFIEQSPMILCIGVSLGTARNTAEVHITDPRIDRVIIARMTHEYYMDKIVREKTYG